MTQSAAALVRVSYYIPMRSLLMLFLVAEDLWALGGPRYVKTSAQPDAFALASNGSVAAIRVDAAGLRSTCRYEPGIYCLNNSLLPIAKSFLVGTTQCKDAKDW